LLFILASYHPSDDDDDDSDIDSVGFVAIFDTTSVKGRR